MRGTYRAEDYIKVCARRRIAEFVPTIHAERLCEPCQSDAGAFPEGYRTIIRPLRDTKRPLSIKW